MFDSNNVVEIPSDSANPENDPFSTGLDTYVDVQAIMTAAGHTMPLTAVTTIPVCPNLQSLIEEINVYEGSVGYL